MPRKALATLTQRQKKVRMGLCFLLSLCSRFYTLAVDAEESQILGTWKICPAGMELVGPIGMRDEDGNIVPLPDDDSTHEPVLSAEALFQGAKEKIPRHIGQLVRAFSSVVSHVIFNFVRVAEVTRRLDRVHTDTTRRMHPGSQLAFRSWVAS